MRKKDDVTILNMFRVHMFWFSHNLPKILNNSCEFVIVYHHVLCGHRHCYNVWGFFIVLQNISINVFFVFFF